MSTTLPLPSHKLHFMRLIQETLQLFILYNLIVDLFHRNARVKDNQTKVERLLSFPCKPFYQICTENLEGWETDPKT